MLILATCATTYALVVLGGVVRATGSGDACPDWPRCHGELLPPLEPAVLMEFSHRLLASAVGFLVLATAIVAWRTQRHVPAIVTGSIVAVVLVGGQIILGGMTVLNELPSNMVMAHLALAATLLATLLLVAFAAIVPKPADVPKNGAASFRNLAVIAALATFVLMLMGSYVSGSGAGLAYRDWPLFDGQLLPDGGRLAIIHATHRFAALGVGLLIAYVALQAWRRQRGDRVLVVGSAFALVIYIAQAFVGAANIWTLLQPAASATHLALAVALWATLVGAALFAHRAAQGAPEGRAFEGECVPRSESAIEAVPNTVPAQGSS